MDRSRTPGLRRVARLVMVAFERLCVVCVLYFVVERLRSVVERCHVTKLSLPPVDLRLRLATNYVTNI
jgi:hypothetical protein